MSDATGADEAAERYYNIDTYFSSIHRETRRVFSCRAPRVGERAPTFRLPLVDGGTAELEALCSAGHVVLIFGCFSAPPCLEQLPALEALHEQYGRAGVSFLFVYTREIHPGEGLPPHRTLDQKLQQARRMRDHAAITFRVCADDLVGTTHSAYGGLPSMACIVDRHGVVVYRGEWTHADPIRAMLENLALRDAARAAGRRGRLWYSEALLFSEAEGSAIWDEVLELAGPKARADHERSPRFDRPA